MKVRECTVCHNGFTEGWCIGSSNFCSERCIEKASDKDRLIVMLYWALDDAVSFMELFEGEDFGEEGNNRLTDKQEIMEKVRDVFDVHNLGEENKEEIENETKA